MKLITLIGLLPVLLFFPVTTGFVAMSLGRKFWFWFLAGFSLPFLALVVLLCMPVRKRKRRLPVGKLQKYPFGRWEQPDGVENYLRSQKQNA